MDSVSSSSNLSTQRRFRDLSLSIGTAFWRVLANPYLLLIVSVVALLLVLLGLFTPQMPDQFNTDPAAAARWKLSVVSAYGILAGPFEVLGVFNLVHSALLRFMMVLIAVMIAVQLGTQLGMALAFRRLSTVLESQVDAPGIPLFLRFGGRLFRERRVFEESIEELIDMTRDTLNTDFVDVYRHSIKLVSTGAKGTTVNNDQDEETVTEDQSDEVSFETRLLGINHGRLVYLRPLLPLGLLLALMGLWLNATFGWEIISPSLAPTESYQHPPQRLEIVYPPIIREGGAAPAIYAKLDNIDRTIAVGDDSRLGETTAITQESAPALLVRAEPPGVRLSRLGESVSVDANARDEPMFLGLEFPESGREEVLALPDQAVGVRNVRLPNNTYSIELYEAGGAEPVKRFSLDSDEALAVAVPDSDVVLTFFPSIGAVAAIRFAPGRWLLWLALLCFVIGMAGFIRNPIFLVAQIAPWSPTKRVVILQSNSNEALVTYGRLSEPTEADA